MRARMGSSIWIALVFKRNRPSIALVSVGHKTIWRLPALRSSDKVAVLLFCESSCSFRKMVFKMRMTDKRCFWLHFCIQMVSSVALLAENPDHVWYCPMMILFLLSSFPVGTLALLGAYLCETLPPYEVDAMGELGRQWRVFHAVEWLILLLLPFWMLLNAVFWTVLFCRVRRKKRRPTGSASVIHKGDSCNNSSDHSY